MFIDVASLNGWIELVLGAELGLSDSPNGLHGFDEVLGQLTFTPTIELGFGLAAEIDLLFAEATVWSYSDSICIGGCSANRFRAGGPLLAGGNDPIPLSAVVSPHPQIVTVPDSDSAMYVQVVETADQNNPTEFVSNLAFSTRDAGGWSPQSIVTQSNSLTRPRLAYTNDGTGTDSAVVVYETSDFTGDLSGLTLNQALTASEIRYRYWDGTAWTAESSVTNNNVADGDVAIAFSGAGDGVLAWTQNTDVAPVSDSGDYSSHKNEIMVSMWDKSTRQWVNTQPLTSDSRADSKPSVFVDEHGRAFVVWIRDTTTGAQVRYSIHDGSSWSTPRALTGGTFTPAGLPDSSEIRIQSLAISGNEDDRFDVLISYSRDLPDGTVESRLLSYVKEHPDSTNANFFNQNGHFEILADGDSYSDIQVSDDIVWWQQHNGRATEVVAAVKDSNASVAQFWSKPFQVTSSANLESDAMIAIDPSVSGGGLIAVYHVQPPANPNDPLEPPVGTSAGIPTSANVGSPLFTVSPEITIDGPMVSETGERGTIGQTTTATARIRNTGLVGDNVTISYYGGPDGNVLQGFETTFLASNAVFDASFDFPIAAGVNTLRIEALLGAGSSNTEVYGAHDNSAQIVVDGFNDLAITFYALTNEQPVAGETIDVFAVLQNFGASPQTFAVEFAARNINDPQQDVILDTLIVTLAGDTFSSRTASWTVPNSGGEYELVTRIDTQDVVLESIEHNNQRRMKVRVVPDLSFQCPPLDDNCLETPPSINVFGTSGISNGELQFVVHNNGSTELTSVPLEIHRSRNGGPFVFHRSLEIESIAAHESRFVELGVDVLDGRSTFQIVIDPNLQIDEPRFNNVAYVDVEFRGLADFSPGVPILERPSISGRDNVVRTTIHNLGIADERDVLVEVFAVTTLLDLPIRRLIGSMRVPTIAALDHHDVRIPIATQELLGPLEIVVQVNRNHDNVERTDTNNHSYLFSDWTTLPPKIAFVADRLDGQTELFRSSGDNGSGTALLKNIGGSQSSEPRELTVVGEDLYFAATGADGEVELFRTTNQGSTTRVKDIAGPLSSKPHELTEYDGLLFFVATGPDGNTELYKSDGTNTGTTRVKNLSGSTSSDPMGLTVMGDALYFSAASNTGERELYRSDGSGPGTYRVANLYGPSVSANPDELTVVQDTLYFVAETPNDGRQLHKSDGTHAGTTLVATIDHLTPEALTPLWDDLYFRGVASDNTAELWKTDGTQGGTYEVRDLYGTTDADPNELIAFDGKLLFVANTANGQREVHVTDGSYSGTDILVDLHGAISARPQNLTVAGGLLFFSAIGFDGERELYTSDGTPTGTIRIKDIGGPVSSSPRNFSPVGSELYFSATMSNGEEELFRSDGTAQGTYLVKNLAGSPAPREIVAFDYIQPQELVEHSDYTVSLAVVFAPQMESVKRRTPIYPRLVARLFEQIGQEAT